MGNVIRALSFSLLSMFFFANVALADDDTQLDDDCTQCGPTTLPEPASMSLFAAGAAGLAFARKFKQKK